MAAVTPTGRAAPEQIDVIVVGAGPAGLAVGACLRRAGIPFQILEAGDHVGTSWHAHYERLHLHTVKRFSALPFMPFPAGTPRYPSRQQVIAYLEAYAERFDLRPSFSQPVISARPRDGGWQVQTPTAEYRCMYLVICTGANRRPIIPRWEGDEAFGGGILHSTAYGNGEQFRGRRVLVVGMGNSGAEIALDLCEHGAEVSIAVRGGVNVVPRDPLGIPIQTLSIAAQWAGPRRIDRLTRPLWRRLLGDLRPLGLAAPPYGPTESVAARGRIPVIDVGTVRLLQEGLAVRGALARFTPDGVVFADGSEEPFDAVVLATGLYPALDAFLENAAEVTDGRGYPLGHGRRTAIPGLYVCGFHMLATGVLREIGREAKRIGRDIAARENSSA